MLGQRPEHNNHIQTDTSNRIKIELNRISIEFKLNIKYGDIKIKQDSKVKYLGCMLDERMSAETKSIIS